MTQMRLPGATQAQHDRYTWSRELTVQQRKIMRMLANPGNQKAEVAAAIEVLVIAAGGAGTATFGQDVILGVTGTSARFDGLIELMSNALQVDADQGVAAGLLADPAPEYVPAGWSDFLNASAIEDDTLDMNWLEELSE